VLLRRPQAPRAVTAARPRVSSPVLPNAFVKHDKMDPEVARRASGRNPLATADVIVTLEDGADIPASFQRYSHNGQLAVIHGYVLDQVPVSQLATLAKQAGTHRLHINRAARSTTALSFGRRQCQCGRHQARHQQLEPVLVHRRRRHRRLHRIRVHVVCASDLTDNRVLAFVDFVNGALRVTTTMATAPPSPDSSAAPESSREEVRGDGAGASLVSLKVLNQDGEGSVGNVLKALDWVFKNAKAYGVRVVNMSVGAPVTESYYTDPLTLATKTLVDSGITWLRRRQLRPERKPGTAVGRSLGARQCAVGPHGMRLQHRRTIQRGGRTRSPRSARPARRRSNFTAKPDLCRAGRRHRLDDGSGGDLFQSGCSRRRHGSCRARWRVSFRTCRTRASAERHGNTAGQRRRRR